MPIADLAGYVRGLIDVRQGQLLPTLIMPVQVEGAAGRLAGLYYQPAGPCGSFGDVLYVPPFGEELNRCRAMASMQARLLALHGIGTLVLDPFGTGDSEGHHSDATWDGWCEDLVAGMRWLHRHGNGCSTLWGVRMGAVMAARIAAQEPAIKRLLLWQPVIQGKAFYTQFLRIRVAAELNQSGGVKTTDELRRRSAAGETLEVSGYHVNPQLAAGIDAASLDAALLPAGCATHWFEVLASEEALIPKASERAVEQLQQANRQVSFASVVGSQFWHVHERVMAPALLRATTEAVLAGPEFTAADFNGLPTASGKPGPVSSSGTEAGEQTISFQCGTEQLVGVLHCPTGTPRTGVVIVVAGGPQYRAGAHRQFVALARSLAESGSAVLRFDLRGMGDSSGRHLGFEQSDPDIRAAIDALLQHCPTVGEVALFGECESASGILFYAFQDKRVSRVVLVNPWVRTQAIQAKVIVRHHYAGRLASLDFWRKLLSGRFDAQKSWREFKEVFRTAIGTTGPSRDLSRKATGPQDLAGLALPERTAVGLNSFQGRALILMSGRDYIAREFDEVLRQNAVWAELMADERITRVDIADADHTFSKDHMRVQAVDTIRSWLRT